MKYSQEVLNRAKMAIEIGQAILDGKEVQYYQNPEWVDDDSIDFDFYRCSYRVKPTPELIPFDFTDLSILIGKVIESKVKTFTGLITGIDMNGIYIGARSVSFNQLFNDFKFLDGSSCGKIKE